MKTSYKIIAAIIAVLSLSSVAVDDSSAKSHHKKHHVKKNVKAVKKSSKVEKVKPVENNVGGGEMKTRIIR